MIDLLDHVHVSHYNIAQVAPKTFQFKLTKLNVQ